MGQIETGNDIKVINNEQETHIKNESGEAVSTNIASEAHGAGNSAEVSHEVTIFAEPLFHIGNFTVTNSLLNSWMVVFFLVIFAFAISRKIKQIPTGLQNFFEWIIDGGLKLCDSVTSSRKTSEKVFPFVFSLFIFILVSNYMGLLPGVGSIGFIANHGGHLTFIPYFRGGTADLNTTLALALMAVILSNIFGIVSIGAWSYFNKFFNIKALVAPFTIFKKSKESIIKRFATLLIDLLVGLVKFTVGLIEIIGEIAKVASLSFRLFGNIFAGEVLLSSIAIIFAFLAPIPFMFLEVIVGAIQALVFSILTLVYFTIAAIDEEH